MTFIFGGSSLVEVGSWHAVIKQPNEYFAALQFRKSSSRLFHKDAQHEPTVFQWVADFPEDRRSALPDVEALLASLDQQVRVTAAIEFCEGDIVSS